MIALAATALVAPALAMAAPATAHAAPATAKPASPVDALRQQFAKKSTVRMDEDTRIKVDGKDLFRYRQAGVLRFGKSGVDASDTRTVVKSDAEGGDSTVRVIILNGKAYLKSPLYDELLPAGRTWVRTSAPTAGGTNSVIDVLRPKVLKTVLASTKSKAPAGRVGGARTTLLRGSLSLSALAKVSPDAAEFARSVKSKKPVMLPWKMWIAADQLPRRFQSSFPMSGGALLGSMTITTDSRFTSWGGKVVIAAPPADLVIDEEDLTEDLPVTPDLTTTITGVAARER
ncbi:hypothetical protein GCM10022226_75070 [Sphaerisporangium flaviroseum]|uniref:DUF2092 domain-containing protein n=1 Tax=Sphaerisporangium flaviroseum TaxID=509199 RepID=A0ABP7JCP0_9ACTN